MTSEDKAKALTNPSSLFKRPREVVATNQLSPGEKTEILKQWELDARLHQVASEEGMSKGERNLARRSESSPEARHQHAQGRRCADQGRPLKTKVGP